MHLAEYHRPVDVMTVRRLLARTPAVALLAPPELLIDEPGCKRQATRYAINNGVERLPVRFTCR